MGAGPVKESQTHQAFSHWLDSEKIPYIHSRTDKRNHTTKGDPDYLVAQAGKCIFLELKVPGGKLSPGQVERIAYLRRAGNRVEVCYSLEACIESVKDWAGLIPEVNKDALAAAEGGKKGRPSEVLPPHGVLECRWINCPQHAAFFSGKPDAPAVSEKAGGPPVPEREGSPAAGVAAEGEYLVDWKNQTWVAKGERLIRVASLHDKMSLSVHPKDLCC